MDAKKLGKKIKLARIEKDLTQGQLATAIDSMQKSISRYETGMTLPSLETLEKIARVLEKPFAYFLDEVFQATTESLQFFAPANKQKREAMSMAAEE